MESSLKPDVLASAAQDDDMKWIGQQALLPKQGVNFTFSAAALHQRLQSKNNFWVKKYRALHSKYEEALATIKEKNEKLANFEQLDATLGDSLIDEDDDNVIEMEAKKRKTDS